MEKLIRQADVQQYVDNEIEENLTLEYKSAAALGKSDGKKREITKDVSAMANSAGGTIIYGIKEYDDPLRKHLPEKLDGIDRGQFSREWLEQVIDNIRPRIDGLVIHPVDLSTGPNDLVYVIEIPQSATAHQATDYRYYKRFNFESVPMQDYEIRDVMGRAVTPDIYVEFGCRVTHPSSDLHEYVLEVVIGNRGIQVVNYFKLEFTFPAAVPVVQRTIGGNEHVDLVTLEDGDPMVVYRSRDVLFPKEKLDVGREISWHYQVDGRVYSGMRQASKMGKDWSLRWTLYADSMTPKHGTEPFSGLQNY